MNCLTRTPLNSSGKIMPPLSRSQRVLGLVVTLMFAVGGCNYFRPLGTALAAQRGGAEQSEPSSQRAQEFDGEILLRAGFVRLSPTFPAPAKVQAEPAPDPRKSPITYETTFHDATSVSISDDLRPRSFSAFSQKADWVRYIWVLTSPRREYLRLVQHSKDHVRTAIAFIEKTATALATSRRVRFDRRTVTPLVSFTTGLVSR